MPNKEFPSKISIQELGCGYAVALPLILQKIGSNLHQYIGIDINEELINSLKSSISFDVQQTLGLTFVHNNNPVIISDYIIASGIFGYKGKCPVKIWQNYIFETIKNFDKYSTQGFAFNLLRKSEQSIYHNPNFYYADIPQILTYCHNNLNGKIACKTNYLDNDLTILVYKT